MNRILAAEQTLTPTEIACVWLGPKVATSLIIVAALLAAWFWTCRRHPTAAWLTWAFMRGLAGR
jgi:hypothetical protein